MSLEFKIYLKQMACLAAALSIWDQDHIKNQAEEFFCSKSQLNNREKWYNIIRGVIKRLTPDVLPAVLYCELLYVIKHIGIRIYEWFRYLRKTSLFGRTPRKVLYENYTKKIYWTPYGTIDEIKTLKLFWLNNPGVNISKVYNMACCYCLEEHVDNLWRKIPRNVQLEHYTYENLYSRLGLNILAYWDDVRNSSFKTLIEDLLRYMDDDYEFYNLDQSVEENMLKLCAEEGYHIGLKYFWNKLDDIKRRNNVVICLKKALDKFKSVFFRRQYRKDRYIEICIFLFQHLTESMKDEMFKTTKDSSCTRNEEVCKNLMTLSSVFLESWPWQEFSLPALEELLGFFSKDNYVELFNSIKSTIDEEIIEFNLPIQNSEMQRKFYQLWRRTPSEYKISVAEKTIDTFFEVWDISSIQLILNDGDMAEDRQSLLKRGCEKFLLLIKENKQEMIEQIFFELLVPKKWEENTQMTVTAIYRYLLENDLDSAKDLLNAECNSDYEKRIYKRKIDSKFVCYYLIKKEELNLADEFLIWKFESSEKVRNFKSNFKHDKFSKDHIYTLWTTSADNLDVAIDKSNGYLNWFLEAEEEIRKFKIEKLKKAVSEKTNFVGYKVLQTSFMDDGHFEIIDDFLSWCLFTEEEIQTLKHDCFSEIRSFKVESLITNDEPELAERFVNWSFDYEHEKLDFIRTFVRSDSGLLSLKYFIGVTSAIKDKQDPKNELIEKFKRFIDYWLPPGVTDDVVMELNSWKQSSIENENQSSSSEINNKSDYSSSAQSDSEMSDDENGIYDVYCQRKKFDLFMKLLNPFYEATDDDSNLEE